MNKSLKIFFFIFCIVCLISCDSSNITHTHNFIDGVCDCGKKESDTTPPHEHSFVNGKCECGEEQGLVDGEYSQGLEYTLSDDESYYILSGIGSCTDTIINIPSLYKDKPVEIIKDHAFANNYSLIGVNISKSIKLIDESSFYGCVNLKTVIFEEESTLEAINRDAFMSCGLTSIIIPNSLKTIGVDAFSYSGLKTVTFEENSELELIGYNAFRVCRHLVSIVIPEGVTTIQNSAFWRCESLRNVILPNSLKEIGYEVFEDCYSLESIIIPENISVISAGLFSHCTSLQNVTFNNGNNITAIQNGAFYDCTSLENVYFYGTIEDWCNVNIDSNPMEYAENFQLLDNNVLQEVTQIVIPESISKIGNNQFFGFSNVTKISLPNTIESIGDYAFACCYSLKEFEIPNGVTSIGEFAFANYLYPINEFDEDEYLKIKSNQITDIVIPRSVKNIGKNAFAFSTNLKTVVFEENNILERLNEKVFAYCTSLESINIPFGVKRISEEAFANCSSLTQITVPDSVTEINIGAFSKCSSLESITLPFVGLGYYVNHFGYIFGAHKYQDNYENVPKSLEEVIITKTTEIGDYAFYGCYCIKTFVLPDNLITIGSHAFSSCNMKEISIPNSVTTIGDYVFSACHSLTYIVIPSSVENIGKCIFNSMSITFSLDIFIDLSVIPDTWNSRWNNENYPIYLQGEWGYNDEGIPTPINS
ncbi:MAG: leucine-rich repeat domain-containing protein [Bacilli bacterium]|nr:leucine-rich repeat domain-containing protein [Bacilli bacterium]